MSTISVVIHTKNAAETLPEALRSVSFADEVVVIDMQSQDETLHIARKANAKVHSVPDHGYADPVRNFGLKQTHSDWVLVLDADESIPRTLKEKLLSLAEDSSSADAYYLPRKNIIFAEWLSHTGWWPDYQLRFFRRGSVTWPEAVHAQPVANGRVEQLPASEDLAIVHQNYPSVQSYIARLNRYTDLTQAPKHDKRTYSASDFLETFTKQFNTRFFAQSGIKDGAHGLSLSLLQAMYELVVQLKHWEQVGFPKKNGLAEQRQVLESLATWQSELRFWRANWEIENRKGVSVWWWRIRRKLKI